MIAGIIQFLREIDLNALLTADYGGAWETIASAVRDPQGNLQLALVLFALATLLVALVFSTVLLLIMGTDDDDQEEPTSGALPAVIAPAVTAVSASDQEIARKRARYVSAAVWALALVLVWVGVGWSTSRDDVCAGCHTKTIHTPMKQGTASGGLRPHGSVRCVSCHESASALHRYGWGTAPRAAHFVSALAKRADEYGIVGSQACLSCHSAVTEQVVTVPARGLKISHREPVEAGWACLDCHPVETGDVGAMEGGMPRCVSCHDGKKASTLCTTCHVGDISVAAGSAEDRGSDPRVLVPSPDCGGCHDQEASCDPCHGLRMPHTGAFLDGGHARVYVESLWYGDGQVCAKCHTEQRRPCSGCHQARFPSHAKTWAKDHQNALPKTETCTGCHNMTKGKRPGRNFCIDLCHTDHQEWR